MVVTAHAQLQIAKTGKKHRRAAKILRHIGNRYR